MAQDGLKSPIQLDWFNVTYRSVFSTASVVFACLLAGAGYWYYATQFAPEKAASSTIGQADQLFQQARTHGSIPKLRETVERAGMALESARRSYDAANYDDAEFEALHSLDLSRKVIEEADGKKSDTRLVRFYRIEGDVRYKKAGEFSWENAGPRVVLDVGDQVKTSRSGSAQLIYFDGTVTTIAPGSLLEIRDLYEHPVTKVRRVQEKLKVGVIQASTQKRNVEGSVHIVATEKSSAQSEEQGEFRVSYDERKKTSKFDVFKGRINVVSKGVVESIEAGERISAASDGQLGIKEALPGVPRLRSPKDQRVFLAEDPTKQRITLQWEVTPGAARYRLIISDKPLYTDPLYDAERAGTSAVLDAVPPGGYYWKVAAISAQSAAGPASETRSFRVSAQKIQDRNDTEPPQLDITEFVPIGTMVIVNGRTEPGATLWADNEKIDVYDDGRFYAVIRLRREGLNELEFLAQDNAGNESRVMRSAYVELY